SGVGVGEPSLRPRPVVLDHERAAADLPQGLTGGEHRDQTRLVLRQAEQRPRDLDLALVLVVDDPGGGVGDQPFGDPRGARPGVVGPSNIPRNGPSHRSWIASAARRASAAKRSGVVRNRLAISAPGENSAAEMSGSVGSRTPLIRTARSASRSAALSTWVGGP